MDELRSMTRKVRLIKPTQKYQEMEWMIVCGRGKGGYKGRGGSVVEMDARLVMKVAACKWGGGGRSEDLCLGPDIESEDLVRKAFSKMSIRLYNYGEGWVNE
ncbi:unnamed protein product [Brassica rapa]|uniref:Uncharacterized protein n=1 Tax=Brassica campestris TaxID=3711 RepID=A0A8D9I1M2_BRACM|nr:unnamed protein product [Brassica rapa]